MSSHKHQSFSTPTPMRNNSRDGLHVASQHLHSRRSTTPNGPRIPANSTRLMTSIEGDLGAEDDPRLSVFKALYARSEARLASLFEENVKAPTNLESAGDSEQHIVLDAEKSAAQGDAPSKRAPRAIDEEDYDDDSEGEDEDASTTASPLKARSTNPPVNLALSSTAMLRGLSSSSTPASSRAPLPAGKTTEEMRRKLEEDKKATEDAAKRSFQTLFYTLENDRDAMLEHKKLEESERQVDAELGTIGGHANGVSPGHGHQGILSQTNLGASSLTLKNLIRHIDVKRALVSAPDSEIKSLMSEVRKNRSKWASEEKVGQEELYEACEKVLNELKAQTEHSHAFLTKVNKKDAPDYSNIIKHPMDLGNMTKKLKNLQYRSKQEFVDDLNLIWSNCLKYNANPEHFLRRHALAMRKETEKLVPLIPQITIRDRKDVEDEERRLHNGDTMLDGEEDSDDEPIISSRGRKAPSKKSKKGTTARKATAGSEDSPAPEAKPIVASMNGLTHLKKENLRGESESLIDGSQTPPGAITPAGTNGALLGPPSDAMDIDGESMVNGITSSVNDMNEEAENDDPEYKIWKQVTKKDRALLTAERHRLFKGDHLDPDAPALLRTKAGMRSWMKKQKASITDGSSDKPIAEVEAIANEGEVTTGETLAEGMEETEEKVLPDYYDTLAAIPDTSNRLHWKDESEGASQHPADEYLRILPTGLFISPESNLTKKIEENLRQIQKTRKITSKIGVVKQMQLQSQMYQGQFQKHEIVPFVEQDIQACVITDEGPVIAPIVCRAALQRSAAKLLVHAGFDEFQPSALDAITDLAGDYFAKIACTLKESVQAPNIAVSVPGKVNSMPRNRKQRSSIEECILHTLQENGADFDALDNYVTEDTERTGSRLATTHERMKAHLADLLRPALHDAGPDGVNAFNDDSEQFVGGDFAEELGEDFFGFKELGLDLEFGDASMSVPLHLLRSRIHNANQSQNQSSLTSAIPSALPPLVPVTPVTVENIKNQIGLVQNFFLAKLHANNDQPLIEDDDLPQKQRFPKPRLPPTGKITSPRKRPIKESGPGKGHPRKKLKLDEGDAKLIDGDPSANDADAKPRDDPQKEQSPSKQGGPNPDGEAVAVSTKPLTNGVKVPTEAELDAAKEGAGTPKLKVKSKDFIDESGGMISPESLEAS